MALPADGAEAVVTCDWSDSDGPVGAERQMGAKTERERDQSSLSVALLSFLLCDV